MGSPELGASCPCHQLWPRLLWCFHTGSALGLPVGGTDARGFSLTSTTLKWARDLGKKDFFQP